MKIINKILVLLMIVCLVGCKGPVDEVEPTGKSPNVAQGEAGGTAMAPPGTDPSGNKQPDSTKPWDTQPDNTQPEDPSGGSENSNDPPAPTSPPTYEIVPPSEDGSVALEEGKLSFSSCGRYSGAFVEDGTDRLVENVAVILVTNKTDEYLTYASLNFEIDGVSADFVLTGLPAGASAWVLEYNALEIEAGAQFVALESAMQFIPTESWDELEVVLKDGLVSAKNLTDMEYVDGYIYYKQLHTDGNYLGGITYRTGIGDLEAGGTIEVTAGHARAENCHVVRITQNIG